MADLPKPLFWVASSKEDLKTFPDEVRQTMGFALWQAQCGAKHVDAKPLKGFGGAGVLEVVDSFRRQRLSHGLHGKVCFGRLCLACISKKVAQGNSHAATRGRTNQTKAQIRGGAL